MSEPSRSLILLWDYGWLDRTEVIIPPCDNASEVVAAYVRSISSGQFATEIQAVRQPEGFTEPVDDAQWQAVERITSELARRSRWIFALRLTEQDSERFHDWGVVLSVFREFLFANPGSDRLSRCVVGYD